MKDSLNVLHASKKHSEFEFIKQLGTEMLTINTIHDHTVQNHKQIATILQEMASKVSTIQVTHYFRSGRAYFTINHEMGQAGNLFFKSVFDNLLPDTKLHLTARKNNLCVIFRI